MLPEDDDISASMSGGTVTLTEAGKRILNDSSPIKRLVATPKMQTVQIKQENSATPKIIRINGTSNTIRTAVSENNSNSSTIQPAPTKIIRLSTSQLQNIKLGTYILINLFNFSHVMQTVIVENTENCF